MLNLLGMPAAASAHAGEIDQMMSLVHWLMLVLFVGWGAFFVFVLIRFRKAANPRASYAGMTSRWSIYVVFAMAIAEGVLLVAYELPAWSDRVNRLPSPDEATVVRIVAAALLFSGASLIARAL